MSERQDRQHEPAEPGVSVPGGRYLIQDMVVDANGQRVEGGDPPVSVDADGATVDASAGETTTTPKTTRKTRGARA